MFFNEGPMRKLLLVFFIASTSCFAESPWKEFTGSYHISDAPFLDSETPIKEKTNIYLAIAGEPAKEMYNLIKGEPKFSECGENHYYKTTGNVQCFHYNKSARYSCEFSINLTNGKTESVGSC